MSLLASANKFSPFGAGQHAQPQITQQTSQPRVRTLQEIEAEQLARVRGINSPALHHAAPASHQHVSPVVHHAVPIAHQGAPGLPMHQSQSASSLHQGSSPMPMHQGPQIMHQLSPGMQQGIPGMQQGPPGMAHSPPGMHQGSPAMHHQSPFGLNRGPPPQHTRTQSQLAALEGLEREMQAMQLNGMGMGRMGGMGMNQGGMGMNQGGMPIFNQLGGPNMAVGHGGMMGMGGMDQQNQHQPRSLSMSMKQQQQQQLLMGMHGLDAHPDVMLLPPEQREAVMGEAMRKIMETERMEEKRRIKAIKIAQMACVSAFHLQIALLILRLINSLSTTT